MKDKIKELKNKIIDSEGSSIQDKIVEEALKEMYMVGVHVGWKSCGEKIIRMITEETI